MWPGRTVSSAIVFGSVISTLGVFPAAADQGGIGFWLTGSFGSLAATPGTPGWSLGTVYLHISGSADGDVAASRTIRLNNRTANLSVNLDAQIDGDLDLLIAAPAYTFATPVFDGQLSANVAGFFGNSRASVEANVAGALGPIGFSTSRQISDSLTGFGDLFPQVLLKWNRGVQNYMVYGMMNLPVGAYDSSRLANIGLGHWSMDGGVGYTYLNPKTGFEVSAVTGVTYNFTNPSLDYQNGVDWHLDAAVSQFLSKQLHVGLVGYAYQQLGADSGSGARLGAFKSRVFGLGPQIGYLFPIGGMQGYLNLKGHGEFGAEHRLEGWNLWLTLGISPVAMP